MEMRAWQTLVSIISKVRLSSIELFYCVKGGLVVRGISLFRMGRYGDGILQSQGPKSLQQIFTCCRTLLTLTGMCPFYPSEASSW